MGSSPSSMCKATMLDEATVGNKMVHQSSGGSIATALRDHRQSCVIPIQPNRSLPVHPAPHHTHYRSNIAKASSCLVRTAGLLSAASPCGHGPESEASAIAGPEASIEENDESLTVSSKAKKKSRSRYDEMETVENEPLENGRKVSAKELEIVDSTWRSKTTWNRRSNGDNDDEGLIDISASPEIRIDPSVDLVISDEANRRSDTQLGSASSDCGLAMPDGRPKKKRHRRTRTSQDGHQDAADELDRSKIVPPLRLKKIQNLRQPECPMVASCHERLTCGIEEGPRIRDSPTIVESRDVSRDPRNFGGDSKYRIVTGLTPPYDGPVDRSSLREPRINNLDVAKLRYKRSKLIVKRAQLVSKTEELGNEMLRTVMSSPDGSHTRRELQIRQKLNRYKIQIENIEKTLAEYPEAASYVDVGVAIDCEIWDSSTRREAINDFEMARSNSSSRRSSPCSEPPKLSPKFPDSYESPRSPSQFRNSPPILPRAYVTIADSNEDSGDGADPPNPRKGRLKRKRSPETREELKDTIYSATLPGLVGGKLENHTSNDFEVTEEKILHRPHSASGKSLVLEKSDLDNSSSNSLDIVEIYVESKNNLERKQVAESPESPEPAMKRSASPLDIVIDKASPQSDETRSIELRVIDEARINVESTNPLYEVCSDKEEDNKERSSEDVVTVRDEVAEEATADGIPICQRFPTLANWIATISKKQVIDANAKLPEIVEQSSAFQQVISPETVKKMTQETPRKVARVPMDENLVGEQWRTEDWQEQPVQQPQRPLLQPYGAANVAGPHAQPPPALGQDVCSPIAMAGFYARNYLDHYSMAYSYNPTIAAAASLWNSAAILQYPLMRPSSAALLNAQQSRISSVNHQFPGNPMPQRASYRVPMQQHNDARRMKVDNSLNYGPRDVAAKLHVVGLSNSADHAKRPARSEYPSSMTTGQPRISLNSVNPQAVDYRNLLQQPQPQNSQEQQQFGRTTYADSRLGIPGAGWRTGHLLGSMGVDYNYSGVNGWSTNTAGIMNSRPATSTPSFVSPSNVLSINSSSRSRIPKATIESNYRNCDTPNLGKVLSNPNNASNYECSNCGLARPMFKCLGCEVAFYCDENCQARHWNRHVKSCPKKMPKLKKVVH